MTKIKIGPKDPNMELNGHNCEITIDGKPLEGVTYISFSLFAGSAPELTIGLAADVVIEGDLEPFLRKEEEVLALVNGAGKTVGHVKV